MDRHRIVDTNHLRTRIARDNSSPVRGRRHAAEDLLLLFRDMDAHCAFVSMQNSSFALPECQCLCPPRRCACLPYTVKGLEKLDPKQRYIFVRRVNQGIITASVSFSYVAPEKVTTISTLTDSRHTQQSPIPHGRVSCRRLTTVAPCGHGQAVPLFHPLLGLEHVGRRNYFCKP